MQLNLCSVVVDIDVDILPKSVIYYFVETNINFGFRCTLQCIPGDRVLRLSQHIVRHGNVH